MATAPSTRALRALVTTLRDFLPGKLTTADASRFAVVVCKQGPYTIPSSGTVIINGSTEPLTAGSRTAAQVAAEISVTGVAASADADGRLILTGNTAPTENVPSRIEIGNGTANAALGLMARHGNSTRLAIGAPSPIVYETEYDGSFAPDRPVIVVESLTEKTERPVKGDIRIVRVGLLAIMPGSLAEREATLEATRAFVAEIKACVRTGDGGGRNQIGGSVYGSGVISCLHDTTVADPTLQRAPKLDRYFGMAAESFEIRVHDTQI